MSKVEVAWEKTNNNQCLYSMLDTNPLIQILDEYFKVKDREITLCWVPSHVGIQANKSADQAAKEALHQEAIEILLLFRLK